MWRQARGRSPTLVEGQTNCTAPNAHEPPRTRPWWQPSEGNGASLFYVVMIQALALVGLVLFPVAGWRDLAVALVIASIGGVGFRSDITADWLTAHCDRIEWLRMH